MSDNDRTRPLPRKLLLATDLSCRCDRALDRTIALCREWNAALVVVHAIERPQELPMVPDLSAPLAKRDPAKRIAAVEWQLQRDLAAAFIPPTIIVEEGDPTELVIRVAREQGCDLIVCGIARDETFGRLMLGNTVDSLIRAAPTPVLVVKNRAHGPYEHVLVATDFSVESRAALALGVQIQPLGTVLFHAFDAPFSGWTGKTEYLADAQRNALEASRTFLEESELPDHARQAIYPIAEHGPLSGLLQDYVHKQQVDLIVMGLPERGFILETLIGSRARAVLDLVPCDTLLVRAQAPASETSQTS